MRAQHKVIAILLASLGSSAIAAPLELTELSFEQLLDVEITSASRFSQKASEAPASVTVLRGEDFRNFGWRTLADALDSVRGFLTTSNHIYRFGAIRGFGPPGDYNSRILLMVDGVRTNDVVYGQAYLGNEFILDVDLIDQIEIVRGPSSPVYGSNAFFGAVNVITKQGKDFGKGEAAVSWGSRKTGEARVTLADRREDGLDYVISATGLHSGGSSFRFPEFDGATAARLDREGAEKAFAKISKGPFAVEAAVSRRRKDDPTGAYGVDLKTPGNRYADNQAFVDGRYDTQLSEHLGLTGRLYFNQYEFTQDFVYTGNRAQSTAAGRSVGSEVKFQFTGWQRQKIVFGADYQETYRQDQKYVGHASICPSGVCLDAKATSTRLGLFALDEITLSPAWTLSIGARFDHDSVNGSHFSPRLGSIHKISNEQTLKLLYGSSYRSPSVYERFYAQPAPNTWIANPQLKSETIDTYEAVWEQYLSATTRLTASLYHYRIENWIVQGKTPADDIQFVNTRPVEGDGADLEIEHRPSADTLLRASYTRQWTPAHPNGHLNTNPGHVAKLNYTAPLPGLPNLRAGLEARYVDRRPLENGSTGAYTLANATLRWLPHGERGPELSASVYNLFDKRWQGVFPDDSLSSKGSMARDTLAQPGRNFRIKLLMPF